MRVAYVRVSTVDQNEQRQVEALEKHDIERWYTEKISGKDTKRPKLQEMLNFVREGDTVYIHDLSRLARNTKDLLTIVEDLSNRGVDLVSNKENIDTRTPVGKLMLTMVSACYEFERQALRERQREGIDLAKREGRYTGGHKKRIPDDIWKMNVFLYERREITKKEFAERIGVSRPTLDRMLHEREHYVDIGDDE